MEDVESMFLLESFPTAFLPKAFSKLDCFRKGPPSTLHCRSTTRCKGQQGNVELPVAGFRLRADSNPHSPLMSSILGPHRILILGAAKGEVSYPCEGLVDTV